MYAARRNIFMDKMKEGVALFMSAPQIFRPQNAPWEYRQDSDLYYLTGFEEPETICLLTPNHPEHHFVMFVRPRNPEHEIWDGKMAGVEGAIATFGADAAYPIDQLSERLPHYLKDASTLYYSLGQNENLDELIIDLIKSYRARPRDKGGLTTITDPAVILDEMRHIKQPEELDLMRKAAAITAEAHREAMKATHPGLYEYEIQAVVEYIFRKRGAPRNSYPSIVGSGPNATTLHYMENNRRVEDGELLLVDAGAEYGYYISDITRTFPVNGKFSPEQKAIYTIVLNALQTATAIIHPGITLMDVHETTVQVITAGLVDLGLLQGNVAELIETGAYKTFYMHSTSHWIGLDLRDRGKYKVNGQSRTLEPGMVFTVEPGIYIPANTVGVDPKYWNIGIRIEDNVLVTPQGQEVLTSQAPKTIAEIETLMADDIL
jgi:Xaa-Pro aminopeptidase